MQSLNPRFGAGRAGGLTRRFRRTIHVVDSSRIQLVANCMDWARHRRRKAAAKLHLRLDLHSLLPRFAIVDTAKDSDAKRAREVCAEVREGEIVIFDRAYLDLVPAFHLDPRRGMGPISSDRPFGLLSDSTWPMANAGGASSGLLTGFGPETYGTARGIGGRRNRSVTQNL